MELSPKFTAKLQKGKSKAQRSTLPFVVSAAASARTALGLPEQRLPPKRELGAGNRGKRETCFSKHFIPFKFCANWLYSYLKDLRKKKKGKLL